MMADESELHKLTRRLSLYETSGQAAVISEPDLLVLAAGIMADHWPATRSAPSPGSSLPSAVQAVARLHVCRAASRGRLDDGNDPDRLAAAHMCGLLETWQPGTVPLPVASRLGARGGEAGYRSIAGAWGDHAAAVLADWENSGYAPELDAAIRLWKLVAGTAVAGKYDQAGFRANLALALRARYVTAGRTADLDEAITVLRGADGLIPVPEGGMQRAVVLSNLGSLLVERFEVAGQHGDLDEAVTALGEARDILVTHGQVLPGVSSNLGKALLHRCETTGNLADLDAALAEIASETRCTPEGDPDRAMYLSNLAAAYLMRVDISGELVDADQAVRAAREALAATRSDVLGRAGRIAGLSNALRVRFQYSRDSRDLDQAVTIAEAAADHADPRAQGSAGLLGCLATALYDRYVYAGDRTDARRALEWAQAAVKAAPAGHPDRPGQQSLLGLLLRVRYGSTHALADLDAAVEAGRGAVDDTPPGRAARAEYLSNLSYSLTLRFRRSGDRQDLDDALQAAEATVRAMRPGHPGRPKALSNLAAAYDARYQATSDQADLTEAIKVLTEAAQSTPAGHPDRAMYLSNLSIVLRTRATVSNSEDDLSAAIGAAHTAVSVSAEHGTDFAHYLFNLGDSLRARFLSSRDPQDAHEAIQALQQAAEMEIAASRTRTLAAHLQARTEADRGQWDHAVTAYQSALAHLHAWSWGGADHDDLLDAVSRTAGIASDAAAAAIHTGQLDTAITLLEDGRGLLHAYVISLRHDRQVLHAVRPDLAERLDRIRELLDHPASLPAGRYAPATPQGSASTTAHERHQLAREWDNLVTQVRREVPDMDDFLRAPAVDLERAADAGPVVIVNTSRYRCDAILLTSSGTSLVPLPDLALGSAISQATRLLAALQAYRLSPRHASHANHELTDILAWLWDTVVAPVSQALSLGGAGTERGRLPRLWWCPTGPAQFLPLHAAAPAADATGETTDTSILDQAISSYTPTLRALIDARSRPGINLESPMLAIAIPCTPGMPELPNAEAETAGLARYFPQITSLNDSDATRQRILTSLPAHPILHFAGHGSQDPFDPASSALYPQDYAESGPITFADIAQLRLRHAQLAFLSACETARGATRLPDEAVHIGGALHAAGYTHVIAAQWATNASISPDVAHDFYQRLTSYALSRQSASPEAAATALNDVVRDLRARYTANPTLWAQYIHIGP